jgi:hypothetical protein
MVFNTTINNISAISWRSVLLVEEFGENYQPAATLSRRAGTQKYVFEGYQLCLNFYDLLILFGIAITVRYLLCPADDSMRRYSPFSVCLFVNSFVRTSHIFVCWMWHFCGSLYEFSCICNIVVLWESYSSEIICLIAFIFGRIIGHDV